MMTRVDAPNDGDDKGGVENDNGDDKGDEAGVGDRDNADDQNDGEMELADS
jgi:hypothetical protein